MARYFFAIIALVLVGGIAEASNEVFFKCSFTKWKATGDGGYEAINHEGFVRVGPVPQQGDDKVEKFFRIDQFLAEVSITKPLRTKPADILLRIDDENSGGYSASGGEVTSSRHSTTYQTSSDEDFGRLHCHKE